MESYVEVQSWGALDYGARDRFTLPSDLLDHFDLEANALLPGANDGVSPGPADSPGAWQRNQHQ
jgi:hypothetical protein